MTPLPHVTAACPGSGGRLKVDPEDFRVDELPAYLPSGAGPHLYLHVEKRGRTTRDVVRALARALGVGEREVGYAGLKDRAAVTTQWLSFPVARDPDPAALAGDGYRVLAASRHQNKLRPGHARGNAFEVAVRGGDLAAAQRAAAALARAGLPNYYGPQRFGHGGANAALGRALLAPDPHPRRGGRRGTASCAASPSRPSSPSSSTAGWPSASPMGSSPWRSPATRSRCWRAAASSSASPPRRTARGWRPSR